MIKTYTEVLTAVQDKANSKSNVWKNIKSRKEVRRVRNKGSF